MEIQNQGIQNQNIVRNPSYAVENPSVPVSGQNGKNAYLDNLQPGSYVYGQVQGTSEDGAVLLLENGQKLLAKLESGVNLIPGQNMTFQVASRRDGAVFLKPMFPQAALEAMAGKALQNAGFSNTPKNLEIVRGLLELQMPVDRKTIQTTLRNATMNPDIPVKYIALMEKLELPVTREMVEQFQQYQNNQHQLTGQLESFLKELNGITNQLLGQGNAAEALSMQEKILEALVREQGGGENVQTAEGNVQAAASEHTVQTAEGNVQAAVAEHTVQTAEGNVQAAASEHTVQTAEGNVQAAASEHTVQTAEGNLQAAAVAEHTVQTAEGNVQAAAAEDARQIPVENNGQPPTAADQMPDKNNSNMPTSNEQPIGADAASQGGAEASAETAVRSTGAETANQAGRTEIPGQSPAENNTAVLSESEQKAEGLLDEVSEKVRTLEKEGAPIREQMNVLKEALGKLENDEEIKAFLKSDKYRSLLEKGMKDSWLMKPEEFVDKEKVNRTYERIEQQSRELGQILKESMSGESSAGRTMTNVQSNLEFIQELNHVFPYLQLPLQMAGESAHGDLYVFADKKKLRETNEELTAYLHLSMEYLGDVDVYLKLRESAVSTDITLEKEEVLDLFEAHMDELTERLQKKGYTVDSSVKLGAKDVDFAEDILARNAGGGSVSRFSFDVKA